MDCDVVGVDSYGERSSSIAVVAAAFVAEVVGVADDHRWLGQDLVGSRVAKDGFAHQPTAEDCIRFANKDCRVHRADSE